MDYMGRGRLHVAALQLLQVGRRDVRAVCRCLERQPLEQSYDPESLQFACAVGFGRSHRTGSRSGRAPPFLHPPGEITRDVRHFGVLHQLEMIPLTLVVGRPIGRIVVTSASGSLPRLRPNNGRPGSVGNEGTGRRLRRPAYWRKRGGTEMQEKAASRTPGILTPQGPRTSSSNAHGRLGKGGAGTRAPVSREHSRRRTRPPATATRAPGRRHAGGNLAAG